MSKRLLHTVPALAFGAAFLTWLSCDLVSAPSSASYWGSNSVKRFRGVRVTPVDLLFMMIISRITMLLNEIIPPCTLEVFAHHLGDEF